MRSEVPQLILELCNQGLLSWLSFFLFLVADTGLLTLILAMRIMFGRVFLLISDLESTLTSLVICYLLVVFLQIVGYIDYKCLGII